MGVPQAPSPTGQKLDPYQKVFVPVQEIPEGFRNLLRLPGLLKAGAAGATGPLGVGGEEEEEPGQSTSIGEQAPQEEQGGSSVETALGAESC